jgi:hypothetical protein
MTDWTPPVPGRSAPPPPPAPPAVPTPAFAAPSTPPPPVPAPFVAPAMPAPAMPAPAIPALAPPMSVGVNLPAAQDPNSWAAQAQNSWAPQPVQIQPAQPLHAAPIAPVPTWAPQPATSWNQSPTPIVEQQWAAIGGPSAMNAEHVVFDGQARELAFQAPADVYTTAATGTKRRKIAALGAAIVLLAGGGATALALRAANDGGGAATPDKAVTAMLAAIEKGDLLGAVDTFPANERSLARQIASDWSKQFTRLSGETKKVDLNKVDGVGLKFEGVAMVDESVNDNIVNVNVTMQKASIVGADGLSPFGRLTDAFVPGASSEDDPGTSSNDATTNNELSTSSAHGTITTVHDSEGWHPSLMYTAFDSIRRSKEADKPTASDAIKARGSDSPEEAVADMVNALGAQDQQRIIELLPPTEWAAAHAYGKVLVSDTTAADDPYQSVVSFSDMKFETQSVDGGKKLIPTSFKAHNEPGSDSDDEPDDVVVTKKGTDCVRVQLSNAGTDETHCIDEIEQSFNDNSLISEAMIDVTKRLALKYGEIGFIVVQEGGKWYVSPIQTVNDMMLTFVSAINKQDIDTIGSFYGDLLGGFFGGRVMSSDEYDNGSSDPSIDVSPVDDSYSDDPSDTYPDTTTVVVGRAPDKAAQAALKVMLTDAKANYGETGTYADSDASGLAGIEPGYTIVGPSVNSTDPRIVSVASTDSSWTAATRSNSGTCFFITDSDAIGTSFGRMPATASEPCSASTPFEPAPHW